MDALLGYVSMHLAFLISPSYSSSLTNEVEHVGLYEAALLFSLLGALAAHIFGLHNPLQSRQFPEMFTRSIGVALLACGLLAAYVFAVIYHRIGRWIMLQTLVYYPVLLSLARVLCWKLFEQRKQRLLLLGAGQVGNSVMHLVRTSVLPYEIVAFADQDPKLTDKRVGGFTVLGGETPLNEYCSELQIDGIVTCVGHRLTPEALDQLIESLNAGIRVVDYTVFVESNFFQVAVEHISGEWFLRSNMEVLQPIQQVVKRGMDILAGVVGLLLSAPLLLLAGLLVCLESRGTVLYSQIRTGRFNAPFRIWKLRTMRVDAEKNGPQWAGKGDDRILWVGRILRRTRLDETPQFWNILCGQMSLVGPRPERPEFVAQLAEQIPFYSQRHLIKPGLTGWAQINYPYGASQRDALNKLKYDLYYLKYASVGLDLQIILRTIGAIMKGAR